MSLGLKKIFMATALSLSALPRAACADPQGVFHSTEMRSNKDTQQEAVTENTNQSDIVPLMCDVAISFPILACVAFLSLTPRRSRTSKLQDKPTRSPQ